MFYRLIKKKSDEWYESEECSVKSLIRYMYEKDALRDAQIEAIKIYLFLKIKCENKPIIQLIKDGIFCDNNVLDDIELNGDQKKFFKGNNIALFLLMYAYDDENMQEDEKKVLEKQRKFLKENYDEIDFENELIKLFGEKKYPEYVFSLPMGAGKTYLMACFMYLDLYFALNEPKNKNFAHNFLIMAPSGLKNSVIPSLKTIRNFDPTFVIPEPSASEIKRLINFEVLDENKTDKKSNLVNNPNVQKIINHGNVEKNFGLILVVNAEKLILGKNGELSPVEEYIYKQQASSQKDFQERKEKEEYERSNELRSIISKIPNMSIFVDEIHHAADKSIKARQVINKWSESGNVNSVLGFSGTPYLQEGKAIEFCAIKTKDIPQIVYYYPLINGINNFLKHPNIIELDTTNSNEIIKKGIKEFFTKYDKVYNNGLKSKLAIYCGNIERLNKTIYPIVIKEIKKLGLNEDIILRYYGDTNKDESFKLDKNAEFEFLTLDSKNSNKRIILLVGIGKEGWDCKSLTGIILSQKGDSGKISVLQTSCRALRKISKYDNEEAMIILNEDNADKLKKELKSNYHTDINALMSNKNSENIINFYNRDKQVKLPAIDYFDMEINTTIKEVEQVNTKIKLNEVLLNSKKEKIVRKEYDVNAILKNEENNITVDNFLHYIDDEIITYNEFINNIIKSSYSLIKYDEIYKYEKEIKNIFLNCTYTRMDTGELRYANNIYNFDEIYKNIRLSFGNKYELIQTEEKIPRQVKLLHIENFKEKQYVEKKDSYFPDQDQVKNVIDADNKKQKIESKSEHEKLIKSLKANGLNDEINRIEEKIKSNEKTLSVKDKTYHYIPYKTDSNFEITVFNDILNMEIFKKLNLEIYYNGDDNLTEFSIKCYKVENGGLKKYVGFYFPDFLILNRIKNKIDRILILETKGKIYANDPDFKSKKEWTSNEFIKYNNTLGRKFDYLYIEDDIEEIERFSIINDKLNSFFKEEK